MSPSTSRFDLATATLSWRIAEDPGGARPGEVGTGWSLVLAALALVAFYAWFAGV